MTENPNPTPGSPAGDSSLSTPTPKPGPRPGAPKPGPRPSAPATMRTPAPLPHQPQNDPRKWGRIDEDGTVYLKTAQGERVIGSWQAGTPEEGIAHYGKRFDDLATEVELLESRLHAHPEEALSIQHTAAELQDTLDDQAVLGDVEGLRQRLSDIKDHSDQANEQVQKNREERRLNAMARKEKLAAEAEQLAAGSTDWKAAGDRIRAILEEWRSIRGIDRKTDDALWKRYSKARDSFNRRRGSHFAELDRNRAQARRTKEELVERARALQDSQDWNATAKAYRDLMDEWKAAGRAPREIDDKLWAEFRAAQDHFFSARNAVNEQRDREFAHNAELKEALLAEYEPQIQPDHDLEGARAKLRELQEKWEEIGYVPRHRIREFENRIRDIEHRVSDAAAAQWRRTDPEAQARAAQFSARVTELQHQAEAAEAKGNVRKAAQLREQAEQWAQWAKTAEQAVEDR
ncbi:DUF349 domain-containing protein [Corynebacterium sp. 3HC-13]|uniref:DUF349 domain-containing protein n=1 Tax=Corynebacterium poyangense TaxID=2684405 RepID=UPI001CCFB2BC|nr:DUF349 domain-containing protein [Corynebacterium poyangense]MBZ8177977.1 DUF349 domain-containing protein [Corynebacterium poyangense]